MNPRRYRLGFTKVDCWQLSQNVLEIADNIYIYVIITRTLSLIKGFLCLRPSLISICQFITKLLSLVLTSYTGNYSAYGFAFGPDYLYVDFVNTCQPQKKHTAVPLFNLPLTAGVGKVVADTKFSVWRKWHLQEITTVVDVLNLAPDSSYFFTIMLSHGWVGIK